MKKIYYLMIVAATLIAACLPKNQPVDTAAAKEAVNAMMDKYLTAWNAQDANLFDTFLADDGLYIGTDPSEFWNKDTLKAVIIKQFADTTMKYNYVIDKREIKVAPDGNSAIVVEHFTVNAISPKLIFRNITRVAKKGEDWKIDFASWNFIFKNEDLGKIIMALE